VKSLPPQRRQISSGSLNYHSFRIRHKSQRYTAPAAITVSGTAIKSFPERQIRRSQYGQKMSIALSLI
jgi:hypothetical protein